MPTGRWPKTTDLLTIGQLARRSGVAVSALRYYEERGLIRSERKVSGHRLFERSTLRRVAFIVFAQRVGLTLGEIREALDRCRLANPADRAGVRGPGARYWMGDRRET